MRELIIAGAEAGQRLDKYLHKYLPEAGSGFLYKMLRKKNITLNGRKAAGAEILQTDDRVCLFLAEETIDKFRKPERRSAGRIRPMEILYEDGDVIFLNKPAGILSQKAAPGDYSVCDYVLDRMIEEGFGPETFRAFTPSVANRLDRNTSGLITAGKTLRGLQGLSELFRERKTEKYYLALTNGRFEASGRFEAWLVKDAAENRVSILKAPTPGAEKIETGFSLLGTSGGCSLVRVRLYTGKTHQIRAALAALGTPVLGDRKYGASGAPGSVKAGRPLLHSHLLGFPEDCGPLPALAGKTFAAGLPADLLSAVRQLGLEETI